MNQIQWLDFFTASLLSEDCVVDGCLGVEEAVEVVRGGH